MKVSICWLREWVDPPADAAAWAAALTMAGIEAEVEPEAQPGMPVKSHLNPDDAILNLELTPNRGDCLSVLGLARETAAIYGVPLHAPVIKPVAAGIKRRLEVRIEDERDCPNYAGRVVAGLNPAARTPDWVCERLRKSGLRAIHPVVDVTNYILLELGQPLHAFDLARLGGNNASGTYCGEPAKRASPEGTRPKEGPCNIAVRRARTGERMTLLNEQTVELTPEHLVISDDARPVALAGVMGGADTGVGAGTRDVFLESACFAPPAVARSGRRYQLASDALHRFERGVDPALQRDALERATELLISICGGQAGPVTHVGRLRPDPVVVPLRAARIAALLGCEIPAKDVATLLTRLGLEVEKSADGWRVRIPSHRYDLRIEEDLIEEVARLHGYDRIPVTPYRAPLAPPPVPEARRVPDRLRSLLTARGYFEAVTYSFVDPDLQRRLTPEAAGIAVDNPIAETMAVMRTTLWSGLLPAWRYNHQRQRARVRLFEIGHVFDLREGQVAESGRIAGLAAGPAAPEQWGAPPRALDFYDVKSDVEALLEGCGGCRFDPAANPSLHPGRAAKVLLNGDAIGWLGELHPRLVREFDLPQAPFLFELDWEAVQCSPIPAYRPLSEFPSARRDLALVVRDDVSARALLDVARAAGGAVLRDSFVFDVYRGPGLAPGCRSVALGLIFQEYSRTLTDVEIDSAVQRIAASLSRELGTSMR